MSYEKQDLPSRAQEVKDCLELYTGLVSGGHVGPEAIGHDFKEALKEAFILFIHYPTVVASAKALVSALAVYNGDIAQGSMAYAR